MTKIDYTSLVVSDIHTADYPDFVDAYISEGYYTDGSEIPSEELDKLNQDGNLIYDLIIKTIY